MSSLHPCKIYMCAFTYDKEWNVVIGMSLSHFSIQTKMSFWNEISLWHHIKPDRTLFRDENTNREVWCELGMRKCSTYTKIKLKSLNLIVHVNAEWTLFQNESHSAKSCEKALSFWPTKSFWKWWSHSIFCIIINLYIIIESWFTHDTVLYPLKQVRQFFLVLTDKYPFSINKHVHSIFICTKIFYCDDILGSRDKEDGKTR